jgi:hypothetical protein
MMTRTIAVVSSLHRVEGAVFFKIVDQYADLGANILVIDQNGRPEGKVVKCAVYGVMASSKPASRGSTSSYLHRADLFRSPCSTYGTAWLGNLI